MPFSNFPKGFDTGITIRGVPLLQAQPGNVFWVSNASTKLVGQADGSDSNNGTYSKPFATLSNAVAACTAGRGDIIMLKPGHAENISSSTALTLSIAGVAVIGLGRGIATPTFTIDTANNATINVTAADCSIQNIRVVANFLSIAAAFVLTTAKEFALHNCLIKDTSGVLNFLNVVKSTGAANTVDGLTVTDCHWTSLGTTSVNTFVLTANDVDRLMFHSNKAKYATTVDQAGGIVVTTGVLTNLDCGFNRIYRANTTTAGGSLISVGGTTSTGWVYNNYVLTLTTTADKLFTTTVGLAPFENRVAGVVGATGFVIPAVDS